ncbi:hypothetical protein TYRP_014081 [Tyrophagus putrescentiae]|nr:hypothetical protein TYRP_014081 [Tyrophagus putrescentiae]
MQLSTIMPNKKRSTNSVIDVLLWTITFLLVVEATKADVDGKKKKEGIRIAIIGAGVGGTGAAYFLSELLDKKDADFSYQIDIFEQSSKVGGRVATVRFGDDEYEAGGSIIHERNKYAAELVRRFGLSRKPDSRRSDKMCIFNGRDYVFCDDSWQFLTYFSLWYRYGFDPLRMQNRVTKVLDHFERIYEIQQKEEVAFEQVSDLLAAMNPLLLNLTKIQYAELLETEFGLSRRFVEELAQAVTLVNYGQTVAIPSFVGMVSFAGSGAELWSVAGGNKQLPIHLAQFANARLLLNSKVDAITYLGEHRFQVDYVRLDTESDELKDHSEEYDYVIVATPMTSGSHIRFGNFTRREDLLKGIFEHYSMHQTVATFVRGSPLPSYAGKAILSCDIDNKEGGSFFTSFSPLTPVNVSEQQQQAGQATKDNNNNNNNDDPPAASGNATGVFKLFSNNQLKTHDLYSFFDVIEEVREVIWHAYPEYGPNTVKQPFPPFKIRSGIYYLNAIEWAASAIEMSLIGGKNVALLVCHELKLCNSKRAIVDEVSSGKRKLSEDDFPPKNKRWKEQQEL